MSKKVDTKNDKKIKNKDDMEDFTKQLNMLEKDTNIMSQLPSYNIKDTDYFINNLENELDQQKTLQMILENKDFDKQLKNIKTFIDNNSDKIDKQLENLKNLSGNIQNIVLENEKLQEDKADLKEILNSQQYKDIANKMREIKMEKEKIRGFLRKKNHKFIIELYDSLLIFELFYYLYINILMYKKKNRLLLLFIFIKKSYSSMYTFGSTFHPHHPPSYHQGPRGCSPVSHV